MFVWFFDVNHLVDSADDEGRIGFFYCNLILNLHGQSSHCCKLLHLLSIPNSQTDLKQKKSLELGALASLLALTSSTTGFFFFFFVIGQFHYLSFHLALKRNKLLNQSHNHTNAHMTTKKNIDFTNIGKVADQNDILLCNRKLIESNFLTKRFMSATASKIKHRKMKKNPTCGNGFNGRSFLSFLYSPIESMKIEPKSSSPIIITITRSKECCTV